MWIGAMASERPYISVERLSEPDWYLDDQGVTVLMQREWWVYCLKDGPCYRYYEGDTLARAVIWEKEL
jgi:hypothetical protein